jgi:hypothetical protein
MYAAAAAVPPTFGRIAQGLRGEKRPLQARDFVHCPPHTEHAFVTTGDGPCVIVMTGARAGGWPEKGIFYPRSDLALRHGAGVETETTSPREAQAGLPEWRYGRPNRGRLPWA